MPPQWDFTGSGRRLGGSALGSFRSMMPFNSTMGRMYYQLELVPHRVAEVKSGQVTGRVKPGLASGP